MTSVDDAILLALDVLRHRPSALISDIDGTLSRIVPRPEDAVVSEEVRGSLRRLARRLDHVAVITARQELVARNMVGLDGLTYMGSYALDAASVARLAESEIGLVKRNAEAILVELPGVILEEKGISFAFHYRNCAEPLEVRLRLLERLIPLAREAAGRIVEGKRVIEVVPQALPDKDRAFAKLVADHDLKGVIFMGDDGADSAVFRAIASRRSQGLTGLAVAVVDAETPPPLLELADVRLSGVDDVEAFLDKLCGVVDADLEWRDS